MELQIIDVISEYDYTNQAWLENGRYVPCGHSFDCDCYGKKHAGQPVDRNAEVH